MFSMLISFRFLQEKMLGGTVLLKKSLICTVCYFFTIYTICLYFWKLFVYILFISVVSI